MPAERRARIRSRGTGGLGPIFLELCAFLRPDSMVFYSRNPGTRTISFITFSIGKAVQLLSILMPFHDLNDDVLAQILLLCDVYSVVSFLKVNKSFRRLALSKRLWISLIHDLSSRYFIPHLDHIHDCSTAQLVAKVKCLVCGPETWSPQCSLPPTVSFSKTFPGERRSRILPGGRYFVVVRSSGHLVCRDVLTGRDVFIRALGFTHYSSWEVDILDDGHTAIFVFFEVALGGNGPELSVLQVDLTTGHSYYRFSISLRRSGGLFYSPVVSGDFLAMSLGKGNTRMTIVINWRELKYVVFDGSDFPAKNCIAFVPGHIILATASFRLPNGWLLMVYTLRSIASRWRAVQDLVDNVDLPAYDLRIRPESITPSIVERLEHNNRVFVGSRGRRHHISMMIHANPIRHDAYKLMVCASATNRALTDIFRRSFRGEFERPAPDTVLFTYALNLGASPNFSVFWTRVAACSIVSDAIHAPISYAGYAAIPPLTGMGHIVKIVDPRLKRSLTKWAGQTKREVMVVSKGPALASLSSTGVLLITKQDGVETQQQYKHEDTFRLRHEAWSYVDGTALLNEKPCHLRKCDDPLAAQSSLWLPFVSASSTP
ncbi:hypothetical protein C8R45DRAFT_1148924 [Mycena sanguinolenta]|nr:hypothetical protein C8R45DRAFT_1148924 [Mycena sanguinolenta]